MNRRKFLTGVGAAVAAVLTPMSSPIVPRNITATEVDRRMTGFLSSRTEVLNEYAADQWIFDTMVRARNLMERPDVMGKVREA